MRLRDRSEARVRRIATIALLLTILPACHATAGHRWSRQVAPAPQSVEVEGSRRTVQRPLFLNRLPTRTFYLNGYAGATYPPVGQGRNLDPTDLGTTREVRRPAFSNWFRGR